MTTNYIPHALRLTYAVLGGCLLCSLVPEFTIFETTIRPINPLSALYKDTIGTYAEVILPADTNKVSGADSVVNGMDSVVAAPIDKQQDSVVKQTDNAVKVASNRSRDSVCVAGITCIEDYSPKRNALQRFAAALSILESNPKSKVRVGIFGDSFIEGDIVVAHLRDTLQQLFGGTGIGLMPVTAAAAKIRPTITHQYSSNWTVHSIRDKDKKNLSYRANGGDFPSARNSKCYL